MSFTLHSIHRFSTHRINKANQTQNNPIEALSSALAIESTNEDPAGSALFEKPTAIHTPPQSSAQQASDAISLLQLAQHSLEQVGTNLQKMRTLAVQASSPEIRDFDQLQTEINQLAEKSRQFIHTTSFADQPIFPSKNQRFSFRLSNHQKFGIELKPLVLSDSSSAKQRHSLDLSTAENRLQTIKLIDENLELATQQKSTFRVEENRLSTTLIKFERLSFDKQRSTGLIIDTPSIARKRSAAIKTQIVKQAANALTAHGRPSSANVIFLLSDTSYMTPIQ